jgi:1,4-alpha-glucan branching enzyme
VVLNTDDPRYGGYGLTDDTVEHLTQFDPLYEGEKKAWLKLYLPARTATVLRLIK